MHRGSESEKELRAALSLSSSIYLTVSIYLFIYLSIYLSIQPSIYLSIYTYVCQGNSVRRKRRRERAGVQPFCVS